MIDIIATKSTNLFYFSVDAVTAIQYSLKYHSYIHSLLPLNNSHLNAAVVLTIYYNDAAVIQSIAPKYILAFAVIFNYIHSNVDEFISNKWCSFHLSYHTGALQSTAAANSQFHSSFTEVPFN